MTKMTRSHPSSASIPIILAGLGMLHSLQGGQSTNGNTVAQSPSVHSIKEEHLDVAERDLSPGRGRSANIGLGILQAPLEIMSCGSFIVSAQ